MREKIQLSDHFTYGRLIRFTLPSIGMMIFTSIYGVVDGFFVSNFAGKTPFAAINLIMPFLMILSTVGFMFGTGGSALVAKTFGEGDREKGNGYFSLFVYVTAVLGVVFAVLGIVFIRPIAELLGAEGEMLDNAVVYARIVLSALPFSVLQYLFQSFCVTAEKPGLGLRVTVMSGVTNMVLDAVLVSLLPQEYKLAGAGCRHGTQPDSRRSGSSHIFFTQKHKHSPSRQVPLRRQSDFQGVYERFVGAYEQRLHEPCGNALQHTASELRRRGRRCGIRCHDVRQHDFRCGVYRLLHRHGTNYRISRRREEPR